MNVRRWLQHLKKLRHRVRVCYLNALFRAKLCSRRLTVPKAPSQPLPDAGTDLLLSEEGRTFRLLSSDAVAQTPAYQDWIAPLKQLPASATPEEVRSVIMHILHDQSSLEKDEIERVSFSIQDYTQSLPAALRQATEFVQFGQITRQPALNLLSAFLAEEASQPVAAQPAVLLLHGQPLAISQSSCAQVTSTEPRKGSTSKQLQR
jgi:hypothetical protein